MALVELTHENVVAIEPLGTSGFTGSGIYIIDHEWTQAKILARIVACGPNVTEVAPDDVCLFRRHAFEQWYCADGSDLWVSSTANILAKVGGWDETVECIGASQGNG